MEIITQFFGSQIATIIKFGLFIYLYHRFQIAEVISFPTLWVYILSNVICFIVAIMMIDLLEGNTILRYEPIYNADGLLIDILLNYSIDTKSGYIIDSEYLSNMLPKCLSISELYSLLDMYKDKIAS